MKNKNSATPPAELAERGLDYDCVITPERIAAASAETMTTLPPELEALMPEPAGFRTRYRSEPEMIGHYPWTYADAGRRRRNYDRPEHEYEDLFTADQVRQAMLDATERAAKKCDEQAECHSEFKNTQAAIGCDGCAAAIRGDGGHHGKT